MKTFQGVSKKDGTDLSTDRDRDNTKENTGRNVR